MAQVGVDDPDDLRLGGGEPLDDGGAQPELAGAVDDADRAESRASASATCPVPSGELSSTITSSPWMPAPSYAAKIACTSSGKRSRSL